MDTGIVYDIRSFSVHDGPGIRTTVFLKGCPLRCTWCHNPESIDFGPGTWTCERKTGSHMSSYEEIIGQKMSALEVMDRIMNDRPFFEESGGGITISGGEPLAQAGFCLELIKQCKAHGIHTAIDTSGYAMEDELQPLLSITDLFLFDLKIIDPDEHLRHTGTDNQVILDNFRKVYHSGSRIMVRIPLVEGFTDTDDNIRDLVGFMKDYPEVDRIDLLPYHALSRNKYRKLGRAYLLEDMDDYPTKKAMEIKKRFDCLACFVSIGG